jgi:hypothetical protein
MRLFFFSFLFILINYNINAQVKPQSFDSIPMGNGYYIVNGSSRIFVYSNGDTLSGDYDQYRGFDGNVLFREHSGSFKIEGIYDNYWGFNGLCSQTMKNGETYVGTYVKWKKEGLFKHTDTFGRIKKIYFHNDEKYKEEGDPGFIEFDQLNDFKKQLYYIDNGYFLNKLKSRQLKSGAPNDRTQFVGNFSFNFDNLEFCNLSIIAKNNYYSNDDCISLTSAREANNLVYLTFKGSIYLTEDHYSISSNFNSNLKIEKHIKNEPSTYLQKQIELQTELDKNGHFISYRVCFFDQEGHPDCGGSTLPYGGSFNKEIIIPEAPSLDKFAKSLFLQNSIKIENLEICKNDFDEGLDFEQATKACTNLGDGWRLPTINELNILFQNRKKIGGFQDDFYWSSETKGNLVSFVNFSSKEIEGTKSGHKSLITKKSTAFVRAVRVLPKIEDLKKNNNLRQLKNSNKIGNLEIYQTVEPVLLNWNAAVIKCNELGNGWRLPTKEELNILYKNQDIIGGFDDHAFWSSTEALSTETENVWTQWFYRAFNGRQRIVSKEDKLYFRAVRNIIDTSNFQVENKLNNTKKLLPILSFNFENLKVATLDLPFKLNWEEANKICDQIGDDWRLPTKEEAALMYKYKDVIRNIKNETYWTSLSNEKNLAWFQDFTISNVNNFTNKDYDFSVRLVKDNKDTSTWKSQIIGNTIKIGKLEVAQHDYPTHLTYKDALKCMDKIKNRWRLPSKEELNIIYKNKNLFGGFKDSPPLWSSSVNSSGQPILVFSHYTGPIEILGEVSDNYKGAIRLVRSVK